VFGPGPDLGPSAGNNIQPRDLAYRDENRSYMNIYYRQIYVVVFFHEIWSQMWMALDIILQTQIHVVAFFKCA
jgi:hypothetical protein